MYLIIICRGCGRLLVASASKKTRQCPYCGSRSILSKVQLIGSATTAREASELVQQLKRKR